MKILYGQLRYSWKTWKSFVKKMELRYDLDVKTFTLDER